MMMRLSAKEWNIISLFTMARSLKTLQVMLYLLMSLQVQFIVGQETYFMYGHIRGKTLTTRNGQEVNAYLGIPYAKPPVGPLRFKSPEKPRPWDGTLVADTDPNQCPQIDDDGSVVGNEDCLYLNVYSLKSSEGNDHFYPVMVYIHGGDFVRGNASSTNFGPQYLLDKDVVLVTMNYRLGILGFLATGDRHAPGNFGLKDQNLALRWVKENILWFGGHPNKITIFGQDAGAASVHMHSLSEASEGLFDQYILQSGNAFAFWAFNDRDEYNMQAKHLGKYLDCSTKDSKALVDCLREVDIHKLVDSNDIFNDTFYRFATWGPTEERHESGAFMPFYPLHKMLQYGLKQYPAIVGGVRDEGLMLTAQLYANDTIYEKYTKNFDAFIRYITSISFGDKPDLYAPRFKNFYFKGTDPSDKGPFLKQMTKFISDAAFLYSADYISRIKSMDMQEAPTYFYSFEYRGNISETSRVIGTNDDIGVTHGDDLIYIFPMSTEFGQHLHGLSESDDLIIDTMIELWTSFAHTGTPVSKRFPELYYWPPYSSERQYLKIGDDSDASLSRHDHFHSMRFDYWQSLITIQLLAQVFCYEERGCDNFDLTEVSEFSA